MNHLTDYDIRKKWIPHVKDMVNLAVDLADWVIVRRRMREADDPAPDRCAHCWNEARGEMSKYCDYCWGTGFDGGYYPSQIVRASVSDEIEKLVRFERGKLVLSTPTATLPPEIIVQDEDLMAWVRYDQHRNEILQELWRYKIEDVNYLVWDTEKLGTEVSLVRLDSRFELELRIPFTVNSLDATWSERGDATTADDPNPNN